MINWMVTFFLLALLSAGIGMGGVAGDLSSVAEMLAGAFLLLSLSALVYSLITGKKPVNPPF